MSEVEDDPQYYEGKCGTCRFFYAGACRRYPPQVIFGTFEDSTLWPDVRVYEWCGEYSKTGKAISPTPEGSTNG